MKDGDGFDPAEQVLEEAFKGAHLQFGDLSGENGLLTKTGPVTQSLLHRMISADIEHIENELKTALFISLEEPDLFVHAYSKCLILGLDPLPIKLTLIARNAGKNADLRRDILHTLTHTSFTTNYQRQRNDTRKSKESPLSP